MRDLQGHLEEPDPPMAGVRHVEMTYLGNGGWLIRRDKDVIATAPFVSNFGGLGLRIYLPADPREGAIQARVPPMPDVRIMLLGHGHHDHAMDLPYILEHKAPHAASIVVAAAHFVLRAQGSR